jgi:hypothetical protein
VAHVFSFLCCVFVCLRPVSCVPNVVSVSELHILGCPFVFSNVYLIHYIMLGPGAVTPIIYSIHLSSIIFTL